MGCMGLRGEKTKIWLRVLGSPHAPPLIYTILPYTDFVVPPQLRCLDPPQSHLHLRFGTTGVR